ncbi:MAG TPA: 6-phosphogluconolactonase [Chromatiaceae bacterium]|jgi:6-phosphogluconolactonase|nr:6-phosphogluconolactonase [Chromatiaceae bacterium]HIN81722.1 6-phosphogluconolactonase [Chromatiales bacterium]HIA07837.1 6-phosphogluconolactonase [Chromatiaceae bacterium]HIB84471.1 6-phosphogluconolactonase [Chromatiaceae bacterium]HIO14882.1 6-phosphogluconolactonase [Chromatiales bacterium]
MTEYRKIQILTDADQVSRVAAEQFVELARRAHAEDRDFFVALSGGSTPKRMYEYLAEADSRDAVNWERVQIFWGDERYVDADHADSNQRMTREAWLDHISIPKENIHPITNQANSPEVDAADYANTIQALVPTNRFDLPEFDLVLLGLGSDGHTASLFPGTDAVDETEKFVTYAAPEGQNSPRISITFPVINAARRIILLVAGDNKKQVVKRTLMGSKQEQSLPIDKLRPSGELLWLLDTSAGSGLSDTVGTNAASF